MRADGGNALETGRWKMGWKGYLMASPAHKLRLQGFLGKGK